MLAEKDLNIKEVYVALLDEGVDVWKPVNAEYLGGNKYRLLENNDYDENVERWEFPPGSIVKCDNKLIQDGKIFAAVKLVSL